jgi:hypothetical protein
VPRQRSRKHDQDALRAAIHGRGAERLPFKPIGSSARTYQSLALEVLRYIERIARERMKAACEIRRLAEKIDEQRARRLMLSREVEAERERKRELVRPSLAMIADETIRNELEKEDTTVNTDELDAVRASITRAAHERERAIWSAHDTRADDDLRTAILRLVIGDHGYSPREAAHIANLIGKPEARRLPALRIPSIGNVTSETTARRLLTRMQEERRNVVKLANKRLRQARSQSGDYAFLRLATPEARRSVVEGLAGEARAALLSLADVMPEQSQYRLRLRARGTR